MNDYKTLVLALRKRAVNLKEKFSTNASLLAELTEAADAIKELSKRLDESIPKGDAEIIISEMAKPRWIPVAERLPYTMKDKSVYSGWSAEIAPSDDVLCYLGSEKRQTVAWYSHTYKEWTTVDENTVYKHGEITHWQPLPEPPKEKT